MATLKTNYKDDMFSGDRKYREIRNSDGTVSFEDVTVYSQTGDVFASADINATNAEVNAVNQNLTEKVSQYSDTTYSVVKGLGVDTTNKKLGLIIEGEGGADTLFPFSGGTLGVAWGFRHNGYGIGTDGVTASYTTASSGTLLSLDFADIIYRDANEARAVVKKAGYFGACACSQAAANFGINMVPTLKAVGDTINVLTINQSGSTNAAFALVYYGETNPFE